MKGLITLSDIEKLRHTLLKEFGYVPDNIIIEAPELFNEAREYWNIKDLKPAGLSMAFGIRIFEEVCEIRKTKE